MQIDLGRIAVVLARLLEVDTVDGGLTVLTRWDLGTDPIDVFDALTTAGYAGR